MRLKPVAKFGGNRESSRSLRFRANYRKPFVPVGVRAQARDLAGPKAPPDMQRLKSWPKAANTLTSQLRRIAPNLRKAGMCFEEERTAGKRIVRIRRGEPKGSNVEASPRKSSQADGVPIESEEWKEVEKRMAERAERIRLAVERRAG